MTSEFLRIGPKITVVPILHGSGDCPVEVRRQMLSTKYYCLAVPLPPSFQADVERAVHFLPSCTVVLQPEPATYTADEWRSQSEWSAEDADQGEETNDEESGLEGSASYVPIDPCQGVIAAIRIALQERMPREFIDLETDQFESLSAALPDPYALKQVSLEKFAAAILPSLPRLPAGQPTDRVRTMAARLRELETRYNSILLVCSLTDWPWIREAYTQPLASSALDDVVRPTEILASDALSMLFWLGELPFITGLYEQARADLADDENLSVDGVKELLLTTRDTYQRELGSLARNITPQLLGVYSQYVRNLSLIERRMTPDLYTLVEAGRQIAGDQFAIILAETASQYPFQQRLPFPTIKFGIGRARLPGDDVVRMKSRLPGHPISWRTTTLTPRPPDSIREHWQMQWDPHRQCSWPAEDVGIERFRTHVKDRALAILGNDLARTEKFSTSLKDGLDIRETLRNWHTGDLFVKVCPPSRGNVDCVVMLFDSPADPRNYPWRITWQAEHHDESTLALFATDFQSEMIGPGIGLAKYGGAVFLFPPREVYEVWQDPRFDVADTLEERLLLAACTYSDERHIALLSHKPPGRAWKHIARRFGKKLVHIPLSGFSQETIAQLQMFHVLNGQEVRSYAAHFIRRT